MIASDYLGKTFGRLMVIQRMDNDKWGGSRWLCECVCGKVKAVTANNLGRNTFSCGCLHIDRIKESKLKHGLFVGDRKGCRLYSIWSGMKTRCSNPNRKMYPRYGGKGVTVCHEWLEYEPFRDWAMANGYEDTLTIDRIDSDGNYEPSNCQWITNSENVKRSWNERQKSQDTPCHSIPRYGEEVRAQPGVRADQESRSASTQDASNDYSRR